MIDGATKPRTRRSAARRVRTYPSQRDPEVGDILREIARRLTEIKHVRGRAADEALAGVEAYAAPYALCLFHEIERLDRHVSALRKTRKRAVPS